MWRKEKERIKLKKFEIINRTLEHRGAIVDFYTLDVKVPNGNIAHWDHIEHKGAAGADVAASDWPGRRGGWTCPARADASGAARRERVRVRLRFRFSGCPHINR